jgi:outer membrane immunogenic protein
MGGFRWPAPVRLAILLHGERDLWGRASKNAVHVHKVHRILSIALLATELGKSAWLQTAQGALQLGGAMKRTSVGLVAALALAAPLSAYAADLAVKAPPPPAPVVYDWSGLYLDVGAGWQNDHFNWTYFGLTPVPDAPFSMSHGTGSITGHIGYQQQFGWVVVGGEVGGLRAMQGNWASVTAAGGGTPGCAFTANFTCKAAVNSASLAGGKLGVDWGNWLFYGVGGVAFNAGITSQLVAPTGALFDASTNQSTHGWYLGAGFDYMLVKTRFGDLIGGVEYEHVNLDAVNQCATGAAGLFCPGSPAGAANTARMISAREDAVWAKLTLKLNPFN